MKYKEIFVSWWFWVLVIICSLYNFPSCVGYIIGYMFVIIIYISVVWGIIWIIKKIYAKLKNK